MSLKAPSDSLVGVETRNRWAVPCRSSGRKSMLSDRRFDWNRRSEPDVAFSKQWSVNTRVARSTISAMATFSARTASTDVAGIGLEHDCRSTRLGGSRRRVSLAPELEDIGDPHDSDHLS